ncbi:MAG: transcriptional regulator [Labilithrix sp.]|nr:transcriptional regulator [Labilithrix sp.]
MEKLTALRVFRRVVELASFSRAARDLRLSNAAVSKNIRELEEELGAPLIQRTTRRLHLTAVGEAYYERTSALLDALAEADREAKDASAVPRGLLRVSCPMSLGLTTVMPTIADFLAQHPSLRIDVEMNDRVVDLIREGYDLGIRGAGPLPDSTLVARKLTAIERVVVAAPSYVARAGEPRSPSQLASHPCLLYSLASQPSRWTFSKGRTASTTKTIEVDGPLRVNSSLGVVQAAVRGLGLALVPTFTVQRELADGRLVRVLTDWRSESLALYAVYPRHRESSRSLKLLVAHLVATLAAGS